MPQVNSLLMKNQIILASPKKALSYPIFMSELVLLGKKNCRHCSSYLQTFFWYFSVKISVIVIKSRVQWLTDFCIQCRYTVSLMSRYAGVQDRTHCQSPVCSLLFMYMYPAHSMRSDGGHTAKHALIYAFLLFLSWNVTVELDMWNC